MSGLCTAFHALLSSGAEFAESEDYLAFRFRLLNTVMLTGLVFSGLFIVVCLPDTEIEGAMYRAKSAGRNRVMRLSGV